MTVEYSLAYKTAAQSLTTTLQAMTYGAELTDFIGAVDLGTSDSRFTVPAKYNGRYGIFSWSLHTVAGLSEGEAYKNGASYVGASKSGTQSSGTGGLTGRSAPTALATSDYFQAFVRNFSTSGDTDVNEQCWGQLLIKPLWYRGAVVTKSTGQSVTSNTTTILSFDQEDHDIGGWHDNSVNNSRLTVPSGVSLVRLSGNIQGPSTSTQFLIAVQKNGSGFAGQYNCDVEYSISRVRFVNGISAPIAVTPGDYFEQTAYSGTSQTLPSSNNMWFAIEELPSDLKYSLLARSVDQSISAGVTTNISWDTETVDTSGWHDGTNPTRVTVPSGVSYVRLACNLQTSSNSSQVVLSLIKNGSVFVGSVSYDNDTTGQDFLNVCTGIIPVSPGDYFEATIFSTNARSITSGTSTWLSIEEVSDTDIRITPTSGPDTGGTSVTIKGYGFTSATGVLFGANSATSFSVVDDSTITCTTPSGTAGLVNVTIQRPSTNMVQVDGFLYSDLIPPSIDYIDPVEGTSNGGTLVTLYGEGFTGTTSITFGGSSATSITVVNDGEMTCITPAHAVGLVDVEVTTPVSSDLLSLAYTFLPPSRITQVPVLIINLPEQKTQISQVPILVVNLPVQGTQITQVPVLPLWTPTPIPLPVPIVPEVPVVETWQWLTVVNIAEGSKEQRSALRINPRLSMSFGALIMDDSDRRDVYQMLFKYIKSKFYYPLYTYTTTLTSSASAGDVNLFFNMSSTDMRDDAIALFDPHFEKTYILSIDTVNSDGVTLSDPLEFDVPSYWYVCPASEFRIKNSASLEMNSIDGSFDLNLESTGLREVLRPNQSNSLLTTFDGMLVLDKRPLANDKISENFDQDVTWMDSDTNSPESYSPWKTPFISGAREYLIHRPEGMDYWRAVGNNLKGRQNPFLLPSFRNDVPLSEVPSLGATVIRSSNIQLADFWRSRAWNYLYIKSDAGIIFRKITDLKVNYSVQGDPQTVDITLSASIGAGAGANSNLVVSYMNVCRLDDDSIILHHEYVDTFLEIKVRLIDQ
jgi:hypothetical protein